MNFLLPRFLLLAIMLAASVWAVLTPADTAADPIAASCVDQLFVLSQQEASSNFENRPAARSLRWQNFLPGSLR